MTTVEGHRHRWVAVKIGVGGYDVYSSHAFCDCGAIQPISIKSIAAMLERRAAKP